MAEGRSNHAIADQLVVTERAIEKHVTSIFSKLSLTPAADLDDHDIDFILENFFHAQRQYMIDVYPRYAELLALRGGTLPTAADRRAAAARFTRDDLRDSP